MQFHFVNFLFSKTLDARHHPDPIFFIFMQFLTKFGQIIGWPRPWVCNSPSRKSEFNLLFFFRNLFWFSAGRDGITYEKIVGLEDSGEYECITATSLEGTYFVYSSLAVINTTTINWNEQRKFCPLHLCYFRENIILNENWYYFYFTQNRAARLLNSVHCARFV